MDLIEIEECTSDNHGWFLVSIDGVLLSGLPGSGRWITLSRIDDGDLLSYVRFYSLKLANKEVGTRRPTCKMRLGFMCHNMVMSLGWQTHRRRSWIGWTVGSTNCCISSWSYFDDILIYSSLGKSTNITWDSCYNSCGNTVCTPSLASVSCENRKLLSSGM